MALNNIDTQFANARSEVRALIDHCNSNTTIGGQSIMVLQSIVDTLDAIQNDSYDRPEGFHRHPVAVDPDPQNLTKPDFKLSSGFRKALEEMRQTDRLC
jgi:hypothetical protein